MGFLPPQYNAPRSLRWRGRGGADLQRDGRAHIHHDPDITRLLDRLERRGLVQRSGGTGRARALDRSMEEFHGHPLGHLGEDRLHALIRLLRAAGEQAG